MTNEFIVFSCNKLVLVSQLSFAGIRHITGKINKNLIQYTLMGTLMTLDVM